MHNMNSASTKWFRHAALVLLLVSGYSLAGDLVVIVNPSNPETALTPEGVKKYYMESQQWGSGEKVKRFFQGGNEKLREGMCRKLLGMSCPEVDRYFGEAGYQKGLTPERPLGSAQEVIGLVKSFKGGIGIIDKSMASSEVKIVYSISY